MPSRAPHRSRGCAEPRPERGCCCWNPQNREGKGAPAGKTQAFLVTPCPRATPRARSASLSLSPCRCPTAQPRVLTLDGEEHGFADVGAHAVAGLAQVVADVLLQDVADEQGAVGQDLDAARQGDGVVLLGVATS